MPGSSTCRAAAEVCCSQSMTSVCICAVVRDFQYYGSTNLAGLDASPDFESCTGSASEKGIVANTLTMVNGVGKPVYAKTSKLPVGPLLSYNLQP